MSVSHGPTIPPLKYRVLRSLLLLCFVLLPGVPVIAQQERPVEQEPLAAEPETGDATLVPPLPDTHATQQAPQELLTMAVHQPENFIGKTLVLDDGANAVTVGPVIDLRRRVQDQNLYLIVDATAYFNTAVEYAVAVSDVDRIEADTLVIPEAPGMHLRGLDYYPDDYIDVAEMTPDAAPADDGE